MNTCSLLTDEGSSSKRLVFQALGFILYAISTVIYVHKKLTLSFAKVTQVLRSQFMRGLEDHWPSRKAILFKSLHELAPKYLCEHFIA